MQRRLYSPARGTGRRRGYVLALIFGVLLSLVAAWPAFAQQAQQDPQPEVVGGVAVSSNKYEFVAAVRDVTLGNTTFAQQFCGGSLIDGNSVLTAAHCVEGRPASRLRVTVGRTVLSSGQGQTRRVVAVAIHPRFRSLATFSHDAAVLRLNRRVTGVAPVKLSSNNALERPGRLARVAGWGNTIQQTPSGGGDTNKPNRMREARVPIVSDAQARVAYSQRYVGGLMVAAGREGRDTCQGDSGGPLFVPTSNGRFQIGITSFGDGCGAPGFPGVYAEVNASSIRSFIRSAAAR